MDGVIWIWVILWAALGCVLYAYVYPPIEALSNIMGRIPANIFLILLLIISGPIIWIVWINVLWDQWRDELTRRALRMKIDHESLQDVTDEIIDGKEEEE